MGEQSTEADMMAAADKAVKLEEQTENVVESMRLAQQKYAKANGFKIKCRFIGTGTKSHNSQQNDKQVFGHNMVGEVWVSRATRYVVLFKFTPLLRGERVPCQQPVFHCQDRETGNGPAED